jgi:chemotaxis protein methyltransferase CheR
VRQHVRFEPLNLNVEGMKKAGDFDVIFLRNVLIYFDIPTKQRVVANVISCLKNGGYLIVGHAETLNGITDVLKLVEPTVYRRM